MKLNPELPRQEQQSKRSRLLLTSKLDLHLRTKAVNCSIWSIACMVLKLGRFGTKIQNIRKDLKCGPGKGRKSFGPAVLKIRKYYIELRRKLTS
jgi:hypothetical protein